MSPFALEGSTEAISIPDVETVPAHADYSSEAFAHPRAFATRPFQPNWLADRLMDLERLLLLEENWDSYGASRIDPRSVAYAQRLLTYISHFEGVAAPLATATPDGFAAFCWDDGTRILDVEIEPTGLLRYDYVDRRDRSKNAQGCTQSPMDLVHLLTQW